MASNDEIFDAIKEHREKGYSFWDRIRLLLCGDLIEREIGITLICVRRGLGRAIQASRGDAELRSFHQWFSSTFKIYFDKAWAYLKSKGIDWQNSESGNE